MKEPRAICADPAGNVYVADTGNQRILKFNSYGEVIAQIGGFGWGKERFDGPVSVWAQNGLDVLVADMNNQRVVRCDKDLHYLSELEPDDSWTDDLRFGFPLDACLSLQSELFCLDGENRRILKLDAMGRPQVVFGGFDAGDGQLGKPSRICITRSNRLLVADEESPAIKTFDMHGNFLFSFGSGSLEKPSGLCEVDADWLLVADVTLKRIVVFRAFLPTDRPLFAGPVFSEPIDAAFWRNTVFILDKERASIDLFEWTFRP